jgi:luciferase family oxidoreductase group 1
LPVGEQLGYKRYWVAEHHAIQGLACSATPVLIGHIAAATKRIRVGSGGVMLPNHAPLVVAEQFGTLEAIYPERIDLGVGRAPGGDFQTMRALRRGLAQDGDDFPALLEELRTYLGPERPGQLVKAIPGQNSNVPITLLGSSDFSAQLAAALGLPFAFAAHFAPDALDAAVKVYRERFQPSEVLQDPYLLVAVPVIAASTDAAAKRLFTAPQQRFLRLIRGESPELLPPVDSMEPLWSDIEKAAVENRLGAAIVGSDATVQVGLEKLVNDTHADEVIVVTDTYEHSSLPGRPTMTMRTELLRFNGAVERDPAIDAWMKERSGELGAIAHQCFEVMRKCGDEVRELLHDGCPVACLGDAPFGYVNVFHSHVNVGFFHGAALPDPARLLQGTAK